MPEQTAGGSGQAPTPASPAANGQAPASAPTSSSATTSSASSEGQNGQAPASTQDRDNQLSADDLRQMRQELAEARRDAAKYRDEIRKRDDASLSADQKRERDFSDLQARTLEQETQLQRLALENAGYRLSASLGISDISAALALIQVEHPHELKYDDAGRPQNIEELLRTVLKAHPALGSSGGAPGAQPGGQRPAQSGGATNPGAGARAGAFTKAQIQSMSPQEYAANREAIMRQLASEKGRL